MIKKVLVSTAFIVLLLVLINLDLMQYAWNQAKGQVAIIANAKSIEEVMEDPSFPDSLKIKIQIISDVRQFAVDTIGLVNSSNYTTLYDQKGEIALWNLSACEPYSFTPKTWSFPLLGSFPYKGFFDLERAKEEREFLKAQNYDTRIRPVGGWSTLGWFSDPILSNMLERSEGQLADLIIHELTHSTLFVKDNIEFNENLASFIGQNGAKWYLSAKYGEGSYELEDYLMNDEDGDNFTNHMLLAAAILDSLYTSFGDQLPDSIKAAQKHVLIGEIVKSVDTLHFHNNRYYQIFSNGQPNNAYFMSFLRYHSAEDSLTALLMKDFEGDLKSFVKGMKFYHEN